MTEISNSYSMGGGGVKFETQVQALFTAMLLTSADAPCLPASWPLIKIKLQGRYDGFQTDDFIAYVKEPSGTREAKLLGQIKHTIKITPKDSIFREVIAAAWADFNNASLFDKELDAIALLTGPLSATDSYDVRRLLDDARMSPNAEDFSQKTCKAKFFSKKKKAKLDAFRTQLEQAKASSLTDEEVWSFLKSYYILGFDLDYGSGVLETLARTLLKSNDPTRSDRLWERIIHHVQYVNQSSGTVQFSTMPSDILDLFAARSNRPLYLSQWLATNKALSPQILSDTVNSQSMLAALLMGKWHDLSELDQQLFETLSEEPYADTRKQLRKVISDSDSIITAQGNVREISSLMALWQSIGNRLLDADLERFRTAAIDVLLTVDPSLQHETPNPAVDSDESIKEYSQSIRVGVAETLAILGSRREWLSSCTPRTVDDTARVAVRDVFKNADWRLWASLNEALPSLAEAAPVEFLDAVEQAFQVSPSPFQMVLTDERAKFYGAPRVYGLIWALEALAWNQEYLIRACLALVRIEELTDAHLIAGNAMDSITKIFLPWLPQTSAPAEKKLAAVQTIVGEHPESGWRLLLAILPSFGQSSSGTHRPKWRSGWVPVDWKKGVSYQEHFDLVRGYASLAVSIAKNDSGKLIELLGRLGDLPSNAITDLLSILNSKESTDLEEPVRAEIWNILDMLVAHHRQYPDADWALPEQELASIEATATLYSPTSPILRYRRLFTIQEHRFYDGEGEFDEQVDRLHQKRSNVIAEILSLRGMDSLWEFLEMVESPDQVGQALADLEQISFDEQDLKHLLSDSDKRTVSFARAYVSRRFKTRGWNWIESLCLREWGSTKNGLLLSCLPFESGVWRSVTELLGECDSSYWSVVRPAPFRSANNIEFAIRKLLNHERPEAALQCFMPDIYHKSPISSELAVKALSAFDETQELQHWPSKDGLGRLFETLQCSNVPLRDLTDLEWKYLLLLDSSDNFRPLTLERELASEPEFFCKLVRSAYRAKGEPARDMSNQEIQEASRAFVLFRDWQIPPGTQLDGTFDLDLFKKWIEEVDSVSQDSGHFNVAQEIVGENLIHSPADPSGLWIHDAVASILNEEPRSKMRTGFSTALFNSRGVHLGSGGREETKLAAKYKSQADDVENAGYHRLATTLRELAHGYERDAM